MHCDSQNPGRRHFLKVASIGTVSLLAGSLLESALAEQPAKTPYTDPAKSPKQLDAIVWDTTVGEGKGDSRVFSHNDLSMIRHMNESLIKGKALKPDAKIILTHIADKLHPPHDVLEKKLLPEGLIPAYEGMSVAL